MLQINGTRITLITKTTVINADVADCTLLISGDVLTVYLSQVPAPIQMKLPNNQSSLLALERLGVKLPKQK